MIKRNDKIRLRRALTLVEVICAMVMITIIFAAVLPQFSLMLHSWDSKQGAAEAIQNGRVLMDHINRNLSNAKRITAVSASTVTSGYIQFVDFNDFNDRYDVAASDSYVEYGVVGSLSDLAGPVNSFKFTCYDANITLLSPVTDTNLIRLVKVDATVETPLRTARIKLILPGLTSAQAQTRRRRFRLPSRPMAIRRLSLLRVSPFLPRHPTATAL